MSKRIQLTLFVQEHLSEEIEAIRKTYNPLQFSLIKSHITLCRENELTELDIIIENLEKLNHPYIFIYFELIKRFSNGNGLLLPASNDNKSFEILRNIILNGTTNRNELQEPHITLIHPRNSKCTDEIFDQTKKIKLPKKIEFKTISLIEQENSEKWKILKEFELQNLNKNY